MAKQIAEPVPPSVRSGKRTAGDGLVRMARNGGRKSAHNRFHVGRGVFKPTCPYCWRAGRLPQTGPGATTSTGSGSCGSSSRE